MFLKEISEFTNNIDFEKDSAFLNAMKNGDWILLDGIENTQAELFEKISSLNSDFPVLNLFEKNNESYFFQTIKISMKISAFSLHTIPKASTTSKTN